ncbi:MAG: hypothetical protein PCFJNLEI_00655 [Verrucomicrobiae bacterium]|nr:hypothetical protein [Verrucomicrobiae bacterium]
MTNTMRLWLLVAMLLPFSARAELKLSGLFSDHMVLQRDAPCSVWGSATPGAEITVQIAGQTVKANADAGGRWLVKLAPLPAGGPLELVVSGGGKTITIKDVLVGDVWICGGQSNMVLPLSRALGAAEVLTNTYAKLRLSLAGSPVRGQPVLEDSAGSWAIADPSSMGGFSGVGLIFGRELQQHLGIPIGLIQCAANGSVAEAWTPREAMATNPALSDMIEIVDKAIDTHRSRLAAWPDAFTNWLKESDNRERRGEPIPPPPSMGQDPRVNPYRPSGMFNGGIAPLTRFAIKGVVWYQGESNGGFAYQYRELFPALIAGWRAHWKQGDFPFLFVQLPTYRPRNPETNGCSWAELREAQLMTWKRVKNTGMAVTIDLGADPNDPKQDPLHPPNKIPVGQRLALVARAVAYGEKVVATGPIYDSMTSESGKIRLKFSHIGGGLSVKGDRLEGFTIAGADKVFVPAAAAVNGNEVVVSSDKVPAPVAVRYNWDYEPKPLGNLYNKEGLPASPFRTDDWPGSTATAKYWW